MCKLLNDITPQGGVEGSSIGVIAPFRAQVALLRKMVSSGSDKDVEVNTVDQYQGRDKDVIIFSCTRTKNVDSAPKKSLPSKYKVCPNFLKKTSLHLLPTFLLKMKVSLIKPSACLSIRLCVPTNF